VVDRDGKWWQAENQRKMQKWGPLRGLQNPMPKQNPPKPGMGQKIRQFVNDHGVEAALTAFGAAGLAVAGLPMLGLAGGAVLAGEGIEMGALGAPLLRAGFARGANAGAWQIMQNGLRAAVPHVAQGIGWGPIRRAVGWEAARRMGAPYV
jgi:hypothetical protein